MIVVLTAASLLAGVQSLVCRQVPSPHASMAACRVAVGMHRALYAHCTSATRCAAAAALVPRAQCLCRAALGDIPRRVQARSEETIHMTPTIGSMKGSCRLMTRGWWPPGRCAVLCVLCPQRRRRGGRARCGCGCNLHAASLCTLPWNASVCGVRSLEPEPTHACASESLCL